MEAWPTVSTFTVLSKRLHSLTLKMILLHTYYFCKVFLSFSIYINPHLWRRRRTDLLEKANNEYNKKGGKGRVDSRNYFSLSGTLVSHYAGFCAIVGLISSRPTLFIVLSCRCCVHLNILYLWWTSFGNEKLEQDTINFELGTLPYLTSEQHGISVKMPTSDFCRHKCSVGTYALSYLWAAWLLIYMCRRFSMDTVED